jgi:hypothetical protein
VTMPFAMVCTPPPVGVESSNARRRRTPDFGRDAVRPALLQKGHSPGCVSEEENAND